MGPPEIWPIELTLLYRTAKKLSAYFVAIPTKPVTHIQKIAPGPPRAIAVPTPAILPVPTVAAKEVIKAPKCEISPVPSLSFENIN